MVILPASAKKQPVMPHELIMPVNQLPPFFFTQAKDMLADFISVSPKANIKTQEMTQWIKLGEQFSDQ